MGKTNKDRHDMDDFFTDRLSSNDDYFDVDQARHPSFRNPSQKAKSVRTRRKRKSEAWSEQWGSDEDAMLGFDG